MNLTQLIDAIQMEDVLLFLFLFIAIGWFIMNFLLGIIRMVMPYHAAPYPMHAGQGTPRPASGGGMGLPFILLILAIIAFFSYSKHDSMTPFSIPDHPTEEAITSQKKPEPIAPLQEAAQEATPSKFSIEDTFDKDKRKRPVPTKRINYPPQQSVPSPTPEPPQNAPTPVNKFGVQLKALSSMESAKKYQKTFRTSQPVYIIESEEGLYKVVVGSFDTRAKAAKYKRKKDWENGFVLEYLLYEGV